MNFAILRFEKLKTASQVRGAGKHNSRAIKTINANPAIKNEILIDGGQDCYETVKAKIIKAGAKTRKNSVLAYAGFLSVSPQYFRPNDRGQAGFFDKKLTDAWKELALPWLKKKFNDNIIDLRLHLDEGTPHMHAIIVPLLPHKTDSTKSRLCARDMFSIFELRRMQTTYAIALKPLKIQRGISCSVANHHEIKKFYAAVNIAEQHKLPKLKPPKILISKKSRVEYSERISDSLSRRFKPIIRQANFAQIAMANEQAYKKTAIRLSEKNEELTKTLQKIKIADQPPDLQVILNTFGLDKTIDNIWIGGGYKIRTKFGSKDFFDEANNYKDTGALALAKYVNNCSTVEAISWIFKEIGPMEAKKTIRSFAVELSNECSKVDLSLVLPDKKFMHQEKIRMHLQKSYSLSDESINRLFTNKNAYPAEVDGGSVAAIFAHTNEAGYTAAEVYRTNDNRLSILKGSKRNCGRFLVGDNSEKEIVYVETVIDAISYFELYKPSACIISTMGATKHPNGLESYRNSGCKITIAYNNNPESISLADQITDLYPDIETIIPFLDDWNTDLKYEKNNSDKDLRYDIDIDPIW